MIDCSSVGCPLVLHLRFLPPSNGRSLKWRCSFVLRLWKTNFPTLYLSKGKSFGDILLNSDKRMWLARSNRVYVNAWKACGTCAYACGSNVNVVPNENELRDRDPTRNWSVFKTEPNENRDEDDEVSVHCFYSSPPPPSLSFFLSPFPSRSFFFPQSFPQKRWWGGKTCILPFGTNDRLRVFAFGYAEESRRDSLLLIVTSELLLLLL